MRKIIAAAIIAASAVSAHADSVTTTCHRNHYTLSCTTTHREPPPPITYTAEEIAAIKARDDEWATYCKPHDVTGKDGLLRAVYAHKDCDIGAYKSGGRSE